MARRAFLSIHYLSPIFLLLFRKVGCSASLPDQFSRFQFGRFAQRFSK